MNRASKLEELDRIVEGAGERVPGEEWVEGGGGKRVVHTLRAVIVVVDLTKSINMKDFKPSRLSVVTSMLKLFFKRAKENTPIIKFALAIVENQTCKFRSHFTYDLEALCDELDVLKVSPDAGHFSMENTLRSCLYEFQSVRGEFHKEILVIQSSPLTKDVRNIFDTIQVLKTARVAINIISMVGWTNVYQKLIEAVKGQYVTVSSGEEFRRMAQSLANPPQFNEESVVIRKLRMGLCRKQNLQGQRLCLCHFQRVRTYYTCNICQATICRDPPVQCPVCTTILILPTDLYNHIIIDRQK